MAEETLQERVVMSAWHAGLAGLGAWEYRRQTSSFGKFLVLGFIAFHADAAINDFRGKPSLFKRILTGDI